MFDVRKIPMALVLTRFALGPVLIALCFKGAGGLVVFAVLLAALLSDIYDGVLARKLGVASETLRLLDSRADLTFWLCACAALCLTRPELARANAGELVAMLVSQALTYVVSFARFGRAPSVHALLSKFFGLSLLIGVTSILCLGAGGLAFHMMIAMGLAANVEVIAILCVLPEWRHDVPSLYHALAIRRGRVLEPRGLVKFFYTNRQSSPPKLVPLAGTNSDAMVF